MQEGQIMDSDDGTPSVRWSQNKICCVEKVDGAAGKSFHSGPSTAQPVPQSHHVPFANRCGVKRKWGRPTLLIGYSSHDKQTQV